VKTIQDLARERQAPMLSEAKVVGAVYDLASGKVRFLE
jgi:hypothetical protein